MVMYHQDKNMNNPKAVEQLKEVAFSYSILSDPKKGSDFSRKTQSNFTYISFELLFLLFCILISLQQSLRYLHILPLSAFWGFILFLY
ncbi:putative DnaJ domain-containing protein [Rosa chinensis]|uniref:Putative DnaJ domain-containing protein n=1 Tax=Rosa chinensis TaxID=74649 RepID=A0A2P6RCG7_ROSCH|nr:putative DnaJ domain-containing protein [Rosa chinensis]